MKKIISLLLISLLLFGCKSKYDNNYYNQSNPEISISSPNFNNEVYIWEDFHITTNRVQGIR